MTCVSTSGGTDVAWLDRTAGTNPAIDLLPERTKKAGAIAPAFSHQLLSRNCGLLLLRHLWRLCLLLWLILRSCCWLRLILLLVSRSRLWLFRCRRDVPDGLTGYDHLHTAILLTSYSRGV